MIAYLKDLTLKERWILLTIFLGGLTLRFLYFPNDISFGYDQARDAFVSLEALGGDLKILGPQASVPGIYHGALAYYVLGPLYKIFAGSPFAVAGVFRLINTLGILLVFIFLKSLFKSNTTALLGAFLYAISFEQTQFALFLGHPALGIVTVLIFYYGLAKLIFEKKPLGLYIAVLGLGLTIQFHFSSVSLVAVLVAIFILFRQQLPRFTLKTFGIAFSILVATVSTYLVAEVKYGFRQIKTILGIFLFDTQAGGLKLQNVLIIPARLVENNLFSAKALALTVFVLILGLVWYFGKKAKQNSQTLFLLVLFVVATLPYIFYTSVQPSYYYSLGASIALICMAAFLLSAILAKSKGIGLILISLIFFSNWRLITQINPQGTVAEINAQEGMLLTDALKTIDYAYLNAAGAPFAVSAVTIPYGINTTWSYLFEWYGFKKYGYLPVWGSEHALGFENRLQIETAQSKLPPLKFIIIEPPKGLTAEQIDSFLEAESIFWDVIHEERYGQFTIQLRKPNANI